MEFTTVVGKKRKHHNKFTNSPISSSASEQTPELSHSSIVKKLEQADFELRNECSAIFDMLKQCLNSCCKQIEANLRVASDAGPSPSASTSTSTMQLEWNIVSYGLGRFSDSWIALYQLALLRLVAEHLHVPPARVALADPQFSPAERAFLSEKLSFQASDANDDCRHAIPLLPMPVPADELNAGAGAGAVCSCTLFYMPHCGKPMYNNVLFANWSPGRLSRVVLFGNSLTSVRDRAPSSAQFSRNFQCIERALGGGASGSAVVRETELSVAAARRSGAGATAGNALDALEPVLNDTALTCFDARTLAAQSADFWAIAEPEYDPTFLDEFIPMNASTAAASSSPSHSPKPADDSSRYIT